MTDEQDKWIEVDREVLLKMLEEYEKTQRAMYRRGAVFFVIGVGIAAAFWGYVVPHFLGS